MLAPDMPFLGGDEVDLDASRTTLFNIAPVVATGGSHEGLLSYLIALSAAHSVNTRDLFKHVIATPASALPPGVRQPGFNNEYALTVNGIGPYAESIATRLNLLTGRRDLENLTLLPLRSLFRFNAPALMSPTRKWCATCLSIKSGERRSHLPLAWSLAMHQVCAVHRVQLIDRCPHCKRCQPFIPRLPTVWMCAYCNGHLGANIAMSPDAVPSSTEEVWVSNALLDLVAYKHGSGVNLLPLFLANLSELIAVSAGGNRAEFCRQTGFRVGALKDWFAKTQHPTLPQFLRVCFAADVLPSVIISANPAFKNSIVLRDMRLRLLSRKLPPRLSDSQRRDVDLALKSASTAAVAEPLSKVCRRLQLSRNAVRYWFPQHYATICNRWKRHEKQCAEERAQCRRQQIDLAVDSLAEAGIIPSRSRVERKLSVSGYSLRECGAREHYKARVKFRSGT